MKLAVELVYITNFKNAENKRSLKQYEKAKKDDKPTTVYFRRSTSIVATKSRLVKGVSTWL